MPKQSHKPPTAAPLAAMPQNQAPTKAARKQRKAEPRHASASRAKPVNAAVEGKAKAKSESLSGGSVRGPSKIDRVIEMMRSKAGASIEQLSKATGWQSHSVRGAISGAIKKKLGLNVTSERVNGTRFYRIAK